MGSACGSAAKSRNVACEHGVERTPGSGYRECDNGLVHRESLGTCAAYVPSNTIWLPSSRPNEDECISDANCQAKPYGACVPGTMQYAQPVTVNHCVYGCTTDAECDPGTICVCGDNGGACRAASCTKDHDCGLGSFCAEYAESCGTPAGFSCLKESDRCQVSSECRAGEVCTADSDEVRFCGLPYCGA